MSKCTLRPIDPQRQSLSRFAEVFSGFAVITILDRLIPWRPHSFCFIVQERSLGLARLKMGLMGDNEQKTYEEKSDDFLGLRSGGYLKPRFPMGIVSLDSFGKTR